MTTLLIDPISLFEHADDSEVTFTHDPIAVALLRSEGDGSVMMHTIDQDPRTLEYMANGDYLQQAKTIRDYYKKRLFFGAMNNKFSSTRFRNDLQVCLEREDIYTVLSNEIGMIARLPDFYEQDICRDTIRKECNTGPISKHRSFYEEALTVKYLTRTQSRWGNKKEYTYWFKTKNSRAVCFHLEGDNPLIELFHDFLEPNKLMQLQGRFNARVQDDFFFYQGKCKVLV